MPFISLSFEIFFIILVCLYHRAVYFEKYALKLQRFLLLIASFIFYAATNLRFLHFLLYAIILSYISTQFLQKNKNKTILFIAIIADLLPLLFFKYAPIDWKGHILFPLGLSFFTFQSISYIVDVYKSKIEAQSLFDTALFISFFPCVSSGPIQRAENLFPQLQKIHRFDYESATDGLKLFAWGLFKKLCIADKIAPYVNFVYADIADMSAFALLTAVFLYSFQIYADFSGYSDMAIGIAKYLGFDIGKNFDKPYFSTSISEFWRKWHISLSSWLRDYVYFSLGGSRVALPRVYFNLMATFIVSGVWHGSTGNFILWGLLHGAFQCIEKTIKPVYSKVPATAKMIITFIIISFAWIFFRADTVADSFAIIKGIFHIHSDAFSLLQMKNTLGVKEALRTAFALNDSSFGGFSGMASTLFVLLILVITEIAGKKGFSLTNSRHCVIRWLSYYSLALLIIFCFQTSMTSNFIYNNF